MAELEELSGVTGITDLHRDKIDHITIPSKKGKGDLKRVEEVFDCWFESGRCVIARPLCPELHRQLAFRGAATVCASKEAITHPNRTHPQHALRAGALPVREQGAV